MHTINIDIDEHLRDIALRGIAARNKTNRLYKQKVLSVAKPHEYTPDNPRKQKEEEKLNQSIEKYLLRRARIADRLKEKRKEAGKSKGRPFKNQENKEKREALLRQLNELKELKVIEQQIIEISELDNIENQIQNLFLLKQNILTKSEMNKLSNNNDKIDNLTYDKVE